MSQWALLQGVSWVQTPGSLSVKIPSKTASPTHFVRVSLELSSLASTYPLAIFSSPFHHSMGFTRLSIPQRCIQLLLG